MGAGTGLGEEVARRPGPGHGDSLGLCLGRTPNLVAAVAEGTLVEAASSPAAGS